MMTQDVRTPGEVGTDSRALRSKDTDIVGEVVRPEKRLATAKARAAMVSACLYATENDRGQTVYIVTRWHLTRELPDLDAVDRWLDQVEGRHARG
jgi:hypothetical protein